MGRLGAMGAVLSLGTAFAALGLAFVLAYRSRGRGLHAGVGGCLALTGLANACSTLGLYTAIPDTFLLCLGIVLELLQPAGLFWVSALVIGAPGSPERMRARRRAWTVTVLCVTSAILAWSSTTVEVGLSARGTPLVALGPLGRGLFALHVALLALGIAQFEGLLRAAPYPLRYRLKFFLPALVAPAVYQIFFSSQVLLVRTVPLDRTLPGILLLGVAVALLLLGLRAEGNAPRTPLYISPRIVYGSATFLVVGLYLVAVGAVGELVRQLLPVAGPGLSQVLVLLAVLALAVALLTRTFQAEMRRFVGRHFYRSKYDYREKWLEVTDAFEACRSSDAILDRLLDVVARTFGSGRIAVWLRFEADDCFHQVRSINLEAAPVALPSSHPVVRALGAAEGPLDLERAGGAEAGDAQWAAFREATLAALGAPLLFEGQLVGFVTLGAERGGETYGPDDRNLLRAIAHHASVLLAHAKMAEERRGAADLEALHRLSAFCVHDLKNLAASLSLVSKNAQTHGADPAFQRSALQTVARTSDKIMALVHRLSRRPQEGPAPQRGPTDVGQTVDETLAALDGALRASVRREGDPVPAVGAGKDEVQQVLLNLVLNAAEALPESPGSPLAAGIVVRTTREGERVILSVADEGPGLGPQALQNLFQPFRTTKTGGLGLGLYECKRIVEAQGGRIRVKSEPGRGTEFQVELPIWAAQESHGDTDGTG